ncbi:hypothetical protein C5167_011205 [Papaver somniferum]|uniref:RNase H type-1 domain-containing protein n=1 Tax=Papaver somniferum TaxID=3469 RepID=A0A4Y7K3W2_PAPSO|nr:hypothetical protein C5167_011205 [Papaver somniferum]
MFVVLIRMATKQNESNSKPAIMYTCIKSAFELPEAEALGLLQAAKWAVDEKFSDFSMEGDCKNLFDYLNGVRSEISWQNQSIMEEVKQLTGKCHNFLGFIFVPKSSNDVFDLLAKEAKFYQTILDWRNVPPACIMQALEVDISNDRAAAHNLSLGSSTHFDVRVTNSLS